MQSGNIGHGFAEIRGADSHMDYGIAATRLVQRF
jgi:hypothetical protein